MPKPPIDTDSLMKAIADAMKAAGMSASQGQIKSAIGGVTKSAGRRAPRTPAKGAAAAKPAAGAKAAAAPAAAAAKPAAKK